MTDELKPGEMHLFVHRWPKKLHKKIKLASVKSGRTIRSILAEACEDWLRGKAKVSFDGK